MGGSCLLQLHPIKNYNICLSNIEYIQAQPKIKLDLNKLSFYSSNYNQFISVHPKPCMGYVIWDMGYVIWDMEYGIWNMGYWKWEKE